MDLFPLIAALPENSTFYGVLMGVGFFLGVYAHAARMPRLVAFSIMLVFMTTILTMLVARGVDVGPDVNLP